MKKQPGLLLLGSVFLGLLVSGFWSNQALAHKTGKEIRKIKACKLLASKRKYKACLRCLKKGPDFHYHPDRLFKRCMLNGVKPFFRKRP